MTPSVNQDKRDDTSAGVWSWALIAVCLGYFMVILDTTIVNVALPAVRRDLGAGVAGLQWVVDGYLLMLAALVLTGGAVADRLGARRIFQTGLGCFVIASILCGLATDVALLVAARLVQGVGAALSVPASLALLRASFPEAGIRARAVGVWGAVAGVAAAAGPILGGLLVSGATWRLVFFVNVPIGIAAMYLTARHVPSPEPRPRHLDVTGQALGIVTLAALTFALIEGGAGGLTPAVIGASVVFLAAAVGFLATEATVAEPMLPLALFGDRGFACGNAIGLLINLGFYGELFVLNLYFQQVLGYSALLAGVALLPQMGVVTIGSALSGRATAHAGSPRPALLIGLVVGGLGLLGFSVAETRMSYPILIGPLMAAGFGMSFTMPAATTAVVDGAPPERAGLASGAINAARQLGGVIGVAVLGSLVSGTGASFIPGLHTAVLGAGAAFMSGALIAVGVPRQRTTNPSEN